MFEYVSDRKAEPPKTCWHYCDDPIAPGDFISLEGEEYLVREVLRTSERLVLVLE